MKAHALLTINHTTRRVKAYQNCYCNEEWG